MAAMASSTSMVRRSAAVVRVRVRGMAGTPNTVCTRGASAAPSEALVGAGPRPAASASAFSRSRAKAQAVSNSIAVATGMTMATTTCTFGLASALNASRMGSFTTRPPAMLATELT